MIELLESRIYDFGEFRLDGKSRRLFQRETGKVVSLTPKAVEVLLALVESNGTLLTKDELLDTVWGGSFVEESNLTQTIFVLRKTLGDDKKEPRYILTIPNRGYRFIAPVTAFHPGDEILEESFLSEPVVPEPEKKISKATGSKVKFGLLGAAFVLLAVAGYWFYPLTTSGPAPAIRTIAVLPFEDLSAGRTEKYLGVSLADALANKFGGLKQITVRPTHSVLKYSGDRPDISQIGRELQADAVLDGRIQREGDRLRVNVQLIRTSDSSTIWTESFDDAFTNFFDVQDSISRRVVQAMVVRMDENERRRFDRRETENAAAYQDYLRGRFFWNKRTGENLQKAGAHFTRSIEKDPNYALAYAGLADAVQLSAEYGVTSPHEAFPKAKAASQKALELDPQLAEAHTSLAYTQAFYEWDFASAEGSFKRALDLNPNYATALQWYGEYLTAMGRFDEAKAYLEKAIEADPISPILLTDLAATYDVMGDADMEIAQSRKVIEIDPNFAYGYYYLANGYDRKGMDKETVDATTKMILLFGEPTECGDELKAAFAAKGILGFWRKRLEQIETRPHLKNFQAYGKAVVQMRLGDKEGAMQSLTEGFRRRDRWMINAKLEQRFIPLRDDPRFQQMMREMGF